MPPLNIPTPAIVHHMAATDGRPVPQNSLEAVQLSLSAGAAVIEIDATALADSDYLLVHDDQLESETSGVGPVAVCSLEQAKALRIKDRETVTAYHVPLLSEVVQAIGEADTGTVLQIDFKNVIPLPNDEPLERLIAIIKPLSSRVIVSSGADWQLRKLRKLAPWLMLGFDIMWYIDWQPPGQERDPRLFPKQVGAYGYYDDHILAAARFWPTAEYLRDRCESLIGLVPDVSAFYLEHLLIAQSLRDGFNWAECLHTRGIKLDAWTMDVTNPVAVESAPALLASGVDLFTTNTPKALAEMLGIRTGRLDRSGS